MIKVMCHQCKKEFYTYPCRLKNRKYNFCSTKCHGDSIKGMSFFDSTGIPSWNKGTKGLMKAWNKGKTGVYSEDTILKIKAARAKQTGTKHPNWRGGVRLRNGYRYIFSPNHPNKDKNNLVCEHHLIMEKYLNRLLNKQEVVHHINGIKSDNRIENLMLFNNNKEHMLYHGKMGTISGRPKKMK